MRMLKNDVDSDNAISLFCYQSVNVEPQLEFINKLDNIFNVIKYIVEFVVI